MRWDDLFADLAAQGDAIARDARRDEIAERYRIELGSIDLRSRLDAARSNRLALQVPSGRMITGTVDRIGLDWLLIRDDLGRDVLIPLAAVQLVRGLDRTWSDPNTSSIDLRLGIRSVLRAIARDRSTVVVECVDRSSMTGMIDRVGVDHFDLGQRSATPHRRASEVDQHVSIAHTSVASVTRHAYQS